MGYYIFPRLREIACSGKEKKHCTHPDCKMNTIWWKDAVCNICHHHLIPGEYYYYMENKKVVHAKCYIKEETE